MAGKFNASSVLDVASFIQQEKGTYYVVLNVLKNG